MSRDRSVARLTATVLPLLSAVALIAACASDGAFRYPGSVEDAVAELKSGGKPDRQRDVGLWLQDQVRARGTVVRMESAEELALLETVCNWAVWDQAPASAGAARPGSFADHAYLAENLADRPGVAIAVSFGHATSATRLQPEHFTHYYDREARRAEPMPPARLAHVRTLFRLGRLTPFEQSTVHGVRYGNLVHLQFHVGLGTEHLFWLYEEGEWRFLHRIGAWVG